MCLNVHIKYRDEHFLQSFVCVILSYKNLFALHSEDGMVRFKVVPRFHTKKKKNVLAKKKKEDLTFIWDFLCIFLS